MGKFSDSILHTGHKDLWCEKDFGVISRQSTGCSLDTSILKFGHCAVIF